MRPPLVCPVLPSLLISRHQVQRPVGAYLPPEWGRQLPRVLRGPPRAGLLEGAAPGSVPGPYPAGLGLRSPSTSGTSSKGRGQGGLSPPRPPHPPLLSAVMMLPAQASVHCQDPSRTACAWPDVCTWTLVLPEMDAPPSGDRWDLNKAAGGRKGQKLRATGRQRVSLSLEGEGPVLCPFCPVSPPPGDPWPLRAGQVGRPSPGSWEEGWG